MSEKPVNEASNYMGVGEGACPTCGSTAPHLHPAVQCEGEVETCVDDFHLTPTPQNTPVYIARVHAKRTGSAPILQPTTEDKREQIARIIRPDVWALRDERGALPGIQYSCDVTLAKADAILALSASPLSAEGGVPMPESCPSCGALPCDWTDDPHQREGKTAARIQSLKAREKELEEGLIGATRQLVNARRRFVRQALVVPEALNAAIDQASRLLDPTSRGKGE